MVVPIEGIVRKAVGLRDRMRAFPPPQEPLREYFIGIQKYELFPKEHRAIVFVVYGPLKGTEFANLEDYWVHTIGVLENPRINIANKVKTFVGFERTLAMRYQMPTMPQEQKKVHFDVKGLLNQLLASVPDTPNVVSLPKGKPTADHKKQEQQALEARLFLDPVEIDKFYKFTERKDVGGSGQYQTELTGIVFA